VSFTDLSSVTIPISRQLCVTKRVTSAIRDTTNDDAEYNGNEIAIRVQLQFRLHGYFRRDIVLLLRSLHYFNSSVKLEIYSENCGKLNDCAIRLLSEISDWVSITTAGRKREERERERERVPFVVYDLKCALEKTDGNSESAKYTYHHHNVFSIGYVLIAHCRTIVFAMISTV